MAGFGLRARLAILALAAALPALLAVLYTTVSEYQRATADAEALLLRFAEVISRRQQVMVEETWSVLGLLSRNAGLGPADPERCNGLLREMYRSGVINPRTLSVVSAAEPDGNIYCSTSELEEPVNIADRPYFQRVMDSRQLTLGTTLIGRTSDVPTVPAAYPVLNAVGEVTAVLVAGLNLPELAHVLPELPKGAVVSVLNARGLVLARHPDPEGWLGKTLSNEPLVSVLTQTEKASVAQLVGLDGVERIYAIQRTEIGDTVLYATVGFATDEVYAASRKTLIGGLIAALGAAVAALLLGRFLGHGLVSRSVGSLANAAERIARGDFAARVPVSPVGDELSSVAEGFNAMAAALAQREAALKESEQRYREVVDLIPAAIWIHVDGLVVFANEYAARIFGGTAAGDLVGREMMSLVHPDDRALADASIREVVEDNRPPAMTELRFLRLDGQTITVEAQAIRFVRDGKVHVLAAGRDITPQRVAEEQLRQAQKMESIGRLTGGVAHDFNNLLTIIIGHLDMALEAAPAPLRGSIDSALQAAERAATLTQRLLAFSRQQALMPERLELNQLVRGMEDMLRRTLGEDVEIAMQLHADVWPVVADKGQLENSLLNLVVNARDAMPDGGKLTIETGNVHLDESYASLNVDVIPGDYAMLAVTDTGVGMAPEVLERAVEPFFTTKATGKGTGLGLSMIYGFVKQSRGHMKLYSEIGLGTSVRLYLPRVQADAQQPVDSDTGGGEHPRGGETVLVVEDDAAVRALVTQQLGELGYRVLEASDGASAQEILQSDAEIDLLFTDVVMPGGMTGRKLAEEAVRQRPGLRTLFTSGYTENSIVHQGRLDTGVQLLSKPYKRQDLARKVREALDGFGKARP